LGATSSHGGSNPPLSARNRYRDVTCYVSTVKKY
jgi:hypothetical protein